jgi:hypothetical protein
MLTKRFFVDNRQIASALFDKAGQKNTTDAKKPTFAFESQLEDFSFFA